MFYHAKELQFDARISRPDPRMARLMLEQFGGANGELSASMQYFVQAFACRIPYPDKYDMLMDIATEELSHLEIVGATIQMLLGKVNGEMKDVVDDTPIMKLMGNKSEKEDLIHQAYTNPHFLVISPGSPCLANSNGVPWNASYIAANAELTVDLRSNIASESRAKIVYETLIPLTDDPEVKRTLDFLMTREVAHFQQFQAALNSIEPNFPPGVFQTNPRYSNLYYNMSSGEDYRSSWNEGQSCKLDEEWQYIESPGEHIRSTKGLRDIEPQGTKRTCESTRKYDEKLARKRSDEIKSAIDNCPTAWCSQETYDRMEELVES